LTRSSTAHFEVDFLARSKDLLQADEITLELVALRSFAELEGERSWDLDALFAGKAVQILHDFHICR